MVPVGQSVCTGLMSCGTIEVQVLGPSMYFYQYRLPPTVRSLIRSISFFVLENGALAYEGIRKVELMYFRNFYKILKLQIAVKIFVQTSATFKCLASH